MAVFYIVIFFGVSSLIGYYSLNDLEKTNVHRYNRFPFAVSKQCETKQKASDAPRFFFLFGVFSLVDSKHVELV